MIGTLVRGCRCPASQSDLDLTFDLAVVTLTYKILSGLYFRTYINFAKKYGTIETDSSSALLLVKRP